MHKRRKRTGAWMVVESQFRRCVNSSQFSMETEMWVLSKRINGWIESVRTFHMTTWPDYPIKIHSSCFHFKSFSQQNFNMNKDFWTENMEHSNIKRAIEPRLWPWIELLLERLIKIDVYGRIHSLNPQIGFKWWFRLRWVNICFEFHDPVFPSVVGNMLWYVLQNVND